MRRSVPVLACVLLLLGSGFLPALSRADLDRVADVSITLKTLSDVADGKAPLPDSRLLILTGTVSDVNIISKDPASFKVRIEILSGEWFGDEDVKAYACYVEFSGPEYFKIFPPKLPANATSDLIGLSTRVLIVGKAVSVVMTPLGAKHVLVDGAFVRPIE
jgi:hypothetical protein